MSQARNWLQRHNNTIIFVSYTALAIGLFLTYETTDDTSDRVTRIEQTPCYEEPTGRECQQIKVESDRARSTRSACVITRKAGLGCPARSGTARRQKSDPKPGGPDAPPERQTSPVPGSGSGSSGGSGSGGDGSSDGGGPSDPAPPSPAPPNPNPPAPNPPSPPPQPPPAQEDSVLGTGVDVPVVDECNLAPILCQ